MKTIIFVCHGNICRSVAAEYIAKEILKKRNLLSEFDIYSRATSLEEIGNDIYPPMKNELKRRGIPFERHFAARINQEDYNRADFIFYMDSNNKYYLDRLLNDKRNIIKPITCYTPSISFIEDPWYSDRYEFVYDELVQCINDIINKIN